MTVSSSDLGCLGKWLTCLVIGGAFFVKVEFLVPGEGIGGSPSPRLGRMISSSSPRSLLLLLTLKSCTATVFFPSCKYPATPSMISSFHVPSCPFLLAVPFDEGSPISILYLSASVPLIHMIIPSSSKNRICSC